MERKALKRFAVALAAGALASAAAAATLWTGRFCFVDGVRLSYFDGSLDFEPVAPATMASFVSGAQMPAYAARPPAGCTVDSWAMLEFHDVNAHATLDAASPVEIYLPGDGKTPDDGLSVTPVWASDKHAGAGSFLELCPCFKWYSYSIEYEPNIPSGEEGALGAAFRTGPVCYSNTVAAASVAATGLVDAGGGATSVWRRARHALAGFSTDAAASTAMFAAGENIASAGSAFAAQKDGTVVLYGVWRPLKVAFLLDTAASDASIASNKVYASGVAAVPALPVPKRDAWFFEGWFDTAGNRVAEGDAIDDALFASDGADPVRLAAKWRSAEFSVALSSGDGAVGGDASVKAVYGKPMPAAAMPSRKGYSFAGYWRGEGSAAAMYYDAHGASARDWDVDGGATLEARWIPRTFAVSLANGAGAAGPASVQMRYGERFPAVSPPSRTGWKFEGYWSFTTGGVQYYDAAGAGRLADGDAVDASPVWTRTAPLSLYARWSPCRYGVTFAWEGGSPAASAQTNATFGLPFAVAVPKRDGYVFAGFALSGDFDASTARCGASPDAADMASTAGGFCRAEPGAEWIYLADLSSVDGGEVVLTAQWTEEVVVPPGGGGEGDEDDPEPESKKWFAALDCTNACASVSFKIWNNEAWTDDETGWQVDADDAKAGESSLKMVWGGGQAFTMPDKLVELRASGAGTLSFWWKTDVDVANVGDDEVPGVFAVTNAAIDTLTKAYDWIDGNKDKSFIYAAPQASKWTKTSVSVAADSSAAVHIFVNKTAAGYVLSLDGVEWKPLTAKVTFDANGGEGGWSKDLEYGAEIQPPEVSRTGWTFAGWSPAFVEGTKVPEGGASYKAQWTVDKYTVSFDANGGEGSMAPQTFEFGEEQALAASGFAREGWVFDGWAETSGGEPAYADGALLTVESDTVLYAHWKKIVVASAQGFAGVYDGKGHGITVAVSDPASGATIRYGASQSGPFNLAETPLYTNAVSATVWFQASAEGYAPFVGSAAVDISAATNEPPRLPPRRLSAAAVDCIGEYDGKPHGISVLTDPAVAGTTVGYSLSREGPFSATPLTFTEASTNTVWYEVLAPGCIGLTNSAMVAILKAQNGWAIEPAIGVREAGKAYGAPVAEATWGKCAVSYSPGGSVCPTAAGTYTAVFSVPESGNWKGLATNVVFTITSNAEDGGSGGSGESGGGGDNDGNDDDDGGGGSGGGGEGGNDGGGESGETQIDYVSFTNNAEYAKEQSVTGALLNASSEIAGTVLLKFGKRNKKNKVRVSGSVTLITGKRATAKPATLEIGADGSLAGDIVFKAPVGTLSLSVSGDGVGVLAGGGYSMKAARIGGALAKSGSGGVFRLGGDFAFVPPQGVLQTELLPAEAPFAVVRNKWKFPGSATVRVVKDKETKERYLSVAYGTKGDKTNESALKLSYNAKTGLFKGSFKAYSLYVKNGALKLAKYTITVTGLVVDGEGTGQATCKKTADGPWSVSVE